MMKNRILYLFMCIPLIGCGSQDAIEIGVEGVEMGLRLEAVNTYAALDRVALLGERARDTEAAALVGVIDKLLAAGLWSPDEKKKVYTELSALGKRRVDDYKEIEDLKRTSDKNRAGMRRYLLGILRASKSWGSKEEVSARLDRLQGTVEQLTTLIMTRSSAK